MAKLLHESTKTRLERKGSRWRAVLITPGQGSSGSYSEQMLEQFGAIAFPAGTKHWFKHPDWSGEQRDPRDQWGYMEAAPVYEPGIGLTAEITVMPHWKDVVDSLAEAGQANLSIYAMGDSDEQGNVTALLPDIKNSVDLVDYPGRPGSGLTEQMLESARSQKPAVEASAEEKEVREMDEKILTAIEALTTSLKPLADFVTEQKAAAAAAPQVEADAKAKEDAVTEALASYEEKLTAIDAAEDLSPKQVETLKSAAKSGVDITPLLESAVEVAKEFKTLSEKDDAHAPGFVVESASGKATADYSIEGW